MQAFAPETWVDAAEGRGFVTSIFAASTEATEQCAITSNLLLYRSRSSGQASYILSDERHNALQRANESLCIAQRSVRLDEAVLGTQNMSVFF